MDECFRCGASGDEVNLYEAISDKRIVKICEPCSLEENFPIIKKPIMDEQIMKRPTLVRDRLRKMGKPDIAHEINLRELIDKNLKAKKMQNHPDLIDNFHWVIQRVRRRRKITREQFAKEISESESNVKLIEQGILPGNNYGIINKIEDYLGIKLRKPEASGFPTTDMDKQKKYILDNSLITEEMPETLEFNDSTTKKLKISDLKDMKKKYEEEILDEPVDSWEEEYSQDDERFLDKGFSEEEE